jgi:flavodoxin I
MKSLVVYDSRYGNTEKIALTIGGALGSPEDILVVRVGEVKPDLLEGINLLVIGSPTQQFRPTAAIKSFLDNLPKNGLKGIQVAAFDTRLTLNEIEKTPPLAFFVKIFGYAGGRIAAKLKEKGGQLLLPGEGFYVAGTEGPLLDGEEQRAEAWARKLFA